MPFYFGTHYLALHLLEGFMPRDQIKLCRTSNGSRPRFDAMMRGEIEATTLTEPYVTLAEKKGCRLICEAFYHGTEVASDRVDAETYGAFNRAVREAVKRINADKAKYLHYFIDYHAKKDPEIGTLKPQDLRASRIVVVRSGADPARRNAAHLRLAEELGHAGADRDAAGNWSTCTCSSRPRIRSRRSSDPPRPSSSTSVLRRRVRTRVGKSPGTDDGNGDGRAAIGVTAGPGWSSAAGPALARGGSLVFATRRFGFADLPSTWLLPCGRLSRRRPFFRRAGARASLRLRDLLLRLALLRHGRLRLI